MNKREMIIPKVEPAKFVAKGNGAIKGYAVNTFQGMVKEYNEDRVSIIMNITKPNYKGKWPKCSYFGVFDGHGGDICSNFLKDNLHKYITENQYFPHDPIEALKAGFKKAESEFVDFAISQNPLERSGSCALVVLVVDQNCYIANVGDSRAILIGEKGSKVYSLSNDHKPDSPSEKSRIEKANGKIYQSLFKTKNGGTILGPWRINPGKLSVSRSFGDVEAKIEKYGGNPRVLIAKPEITYFEINNDIHDFIIMGSDGIYDKLSNEQISECMRDKHSISKVHNDYIGEASSKILNESMKHMSMDNLTSLIIAFDDHGRINLATDKSAKIQDSIWHSSYNSNKENTQKDDPNIMKQEKDMSSKMIEKESMCRKNNHEDNEVKVTKELIKANSMKMLKKDITMKALPSHRKQEFVMNRFSGSLSKSVKSNLNDKIR